MVLWSTLSQKEGCGRLQRQLQRGGPQGRFCARPAPKCNETQSQTSRQVRTEQQQQQSARLRSHRDAINPVPVAVPSASRPATAHRQRVLFARGDGTARAILSEPAGLLQPLQQLPRSPALSVTAGAAGWEYAAT